MSPGTSEVQVDDIAVFLGWERGVGVRGDEVAEFGGLTPELAILVCEFEEVNFWLVGFSFFELLTCTERRRVPFRRRWWSFWSSLGCMEMF